MTNYPPSSVLATFPEHESLVRSVLNTSNLNQGPAPPAPAQVPSPARLQLPSLMRLLRAFGARSYQPRLNPYDEDEDEITILDPVRPYHRRSHPSELPSAISDSIEDNLSDDQRLDSRSLLFGPHLRYRHQIPSSGPQSAPRPVVSLLLAADTVTAPVSNSAPAPVGDTVVSDVGGLATTVLDARSDDQDHPLDSQSPSPSTPSSPSPSPSPSP
ncbi:hypothetical protein ACMFMF_002374 [Clarireedia jacksonii]